MVRALGRLALGDRQVVRLELPNSGFICGQCRDKHAHDLLSGRGLSELITYGEYRTLDMTPLGYERVLNNEPFYENVVI